MARQREVLDLHELQRQSLLQEVDDERRASGLPPRGAREDAPGCAGAAGGCGGRPPASGARENFSGPSRGLSAGAPPSGPSRGVPPSRPDPGRAAPRRVEIVPPPRAREQFASARGLPPDWGRFVEEPGEREPPRGEGPPRGNSRGLGLDIHELLKREAFESVSPACDDHFEKNRPCPGGVYGVSDQYVVLDTFYKLQASDVARGTFQWNFMIQGDTGNEVVGIRDKMSTVIAVQLGPFSMPILPEVPYVLAPVPAAPTGTDQIGLYHNNANAAPPLNPLLPVNQYPQGIATAPGTEINPWVNNPYTQFPSYGRFTIQLREAGLQSYSDGLGARHHYDFTLSTTANSGGTNPNMLAAVPQSGAWWDTFLFTDPLEYIHGITLVFRNPDAPIRFLPDCLYDVSVESDGAAYPGPYLRIRAPGFGLNWGDRFIIRGFQSGNPGLDTLMNRIDGWVAAGDPSGVAASSGTPISVAGDPDVFYTDPAVSIHDLTVNVPALPQIVDVCIAKRRMRIPARFRTVVSRLTNYMNP